MAAARLDIADALSSKADGRASETPVSSPTRRRTLVGATLILAGLALGIAAAWTMFRSTAAPASRTIRFSVPLPAGMPITAVAITSAGDTIVYQADRLYVRGMGDAEARPLPGTDGARNLFLSPDGKWAGFYVDGTIRKAGLAGGDPLTIADAAELTPGAGWGVGNSVIFSGGWNGPLQSVSAEGGGKPAAISTVDTANGELARLDGRRSWWIRFPRAPPRCGCRCAVGVTPSGRPVVRNCSIAEGRNSSRRRIRRPVGDSSSSGKTRCGGWGALKNHHD